MINKRILAVMSILLIGNTPCFGEVLYGARITKIFTQSRLGSDAHLIQIDQTLSSACNANRLYIDFNDKELFAAALAYYLADKPIDIVFFTDAAPKTASGHLADLSCRLVSLF